MLKDVEKHAEKIANEVRRHSDVNIITHIDADGIAAGAIAKKAMDHEDVESSIHFVKQLTPTIVEKAKGMEGLVWFTDLGSGHISKLNKINYVVTDHHIPDNTGGTRTWRHFNPHMYGVDGGREISGAGLVYIIASTLNKKHRDMVGLAIVGASGDLQDSFSCKFEGWNHELVLEGVREKKVEMKKGIRLFGRQTRPIHKILQYADDPILPGLTGREGACVSFLNSLGIKVKDGKKWRRWIDLNTVEKKDIVSTLIKLLLSKGFGHAHASRLVGEIYELVDEEMGTALREAKEFATLLNATARYGYEAVGLQLCMGKRGATMEKAKKLLQNHRKHLVKGLRLVKEGGIQNHGCLQYFHAGEHIRDTIVGIVTGMLLHSTLVRGETPLIGFAEKEDGEVKASARAPSVLQRRGVDLSKAMQKVAGRLGGIGGGHEMAAGATIPKGKEKEFLLLLEREIINQLTL
jgi:RecJ-like exonuclease